MPACPSPHRREPVARQPAGAAAGAARAAAAAVGRPGRRRPGARLLRRRVRDRDHLADLWLEVPSDLQGPALARELRDLLRAIGAYTFQPPRPRPREPT